MLAAAAGAFAAQWQAQTGFDLESHEAGVSATMSIRWTADKGLDDVLRMVRRHMETGSPDQQSWVLRFAAADLPPLPAAGENVDSALQLTVDDTAEVTAHWLCAGMAEHSCPAGAILDALESFVTEALAEPAVPLAEIPIVSATQASALAGLGHRPFVSEPLGSVTDRIYSSVTSWPDRPAVRCGTTTLTYAQLWAAAVSVSGFLLELRLAANEPVGVGLRRSPLLISSLLGIWHAGGGYVPLDLGMPKRRLHRLIDDVAAQGMRWVLLDPDAAGELGLAVEHSAEVNGLRLAVCRVTRDDTPPRPMMGLTDGNRLAYVMYTSGSTGKPKGTLVTHANIAAFVTAVQQALAPSEHEVTLATTPLTFDISVLELFWPLAFGRCVLLHESIRDTDIAAMAALLRTPAPKLLQVTPSTAALIELPRDDRGPLRILVGGEPLPAAAAVRLRAACDSLYNMYGPTEATVWFTYRKVDELDLDLDPISIGDPLPGCGLLILDQHRRVVPIGMAGELYLYGPQVAAGYLNAAEATAAGFRSDLHGLPLVYKTGDRVRRLPDGRIQYLGRLDSQVKIAGNRVELEEIESALRGCPGVAQAAVCVAGGIGDPRLLAFVRLEGSALTDEIWPHLQENLPAHMMPAKIYRVGQMPLTASGKIDRSALGQAAGRAIELARRPLSTSMQDETSRGGSAGVVGLITGFLSGRLSQPITPTDILADKGMTSLQAGQLAGYLWQQLGLSISPGEILRLGRPESIGAALPQPLAGSDAGARIASRESLSLAELAMEAMAHLDPHSCKLHVGLHWRLEGPLDVERLRSALAAVVTHHPILDSVVTPTGHWAVREATFGGPAVIDGAVDGYLSCDESPFDLGAEPPARWTLFRRSAASADLVATFHHICVDDDSLRTLHSDLLDAYAHLRVRRGQERAWQERGRAVRSERQLAAALLEADRAYWLGRRNAFDSAAGRGVLSVSGMGARRRSTFVQSGAERLRVLAQRHGTTPYCQFLALAATATAQALRLPSLIAAAPVSSRERVGAENVVGCFANLVPLSLLLQGHPPEALLAEVYEQVLHGLDHGLLPFAEIARLTGLPREGGIDLVCQLEPISEPAEAGGLAFVPKPLPPAKPLYPLIVRGETAAEDLFVHVDYAENVATGRQASALAMAIAGGLRG